MSKKLRKILVEICIYNEEEKKSLTNTFDELIEEQMCFQYYHVLTGLQEYNNDEKICESISEELRTKFRNVEARMNGLGYRSNKKEIKELNDYILGEIDCDLVIEESEKTIDDSGIRTMEIANQIFDLMRFIQKYGLMNDKKG